MSDPTASRTDVPAPGRARAVSRTDELELIISSLTTCALFSLPHGLFDAIADRFTHLSVGFSIASILVSTLVTGVCYALGTCFVLHLMARAYWVGLVGLQRTFPQGIDWERTKNLGPLTRAHYRDTLPTQASLIDRADRFASSLFAVISMLTLYLLWIGAIIVSALVASGVIGERFGATNASLGVASLILVVLFAGVPLVVHLLDAQLAARVRGLRESRVFAGIVATLRRVSGIAYPQRLVLPVQLTLQSNTRPWLFFAVLIVAIIGAILVGNVRFAAWRDFTVSGAFTFLSDEEVDRFMRSTYYEDQPSDIDRFRPWPRISSFSQRGSFLRVFLPYHPVRDDLVLNARCGEPGERESDERIACVRGLWSVKLGEHTADLSTFLPAQRADISMRGLVGVVPLSGLEPGMHALEIVWNPDGVDDLVLDDRYGTASFEYAIPFLFSPEFERAIP